MMGRVLFWLGVIGVALIAFGMGVELVLEYWYVTLVVLVVTTLIWLQRKKNRAGKAWVSRYADNRKVRY